MKRPEGNDPVKFRQVKHWLWLGLAVVVFTGMALLGFMAWGAYHGEWLHTGYAGTGLLLMLWRAEACLDAWCRRVYQRSARKNGSTPR